MAPRKHHPISLHPLSPAQALEGLMQVKSEKEETVPVLKFNEGDEVKIAQTASEHAGEEGEIIQYLGAGLFVTVPGQDVEQAEPVRWLVKLRRTGAEVAIPESDLILL